MNFRYPVVDMLPLLYLYMREKRIVVRMKEQYQYNKMCPRRCDMYMDQTSPQAESCAKREKLGNISDLNFYWFNCGCLVHLMKNHKRKRSLDTPADLTKMYLDSQRLSASQEELRSIEETEAVTASLSSSRS